MSTIHKALALLDLFTFDLPELRLSELAQMAGLDPATARRHVLALADFGFLECVGARKTYRLGAALVVLAAKREAWVPIRKAVEPILQDLCGQTRETAHASWLINGRLTTIGAVESPHAARVHLDYSEVLPFHCTASGISFLAGSPGDFVTQTLRGKLEKFLETTPTDRRKILRDIEITRGRGFAVALGTYEPGLVGVGVAIRDTAGNARGTLAIAAPSSRANDEKIGEWAKLLREASQRASRLIGNS
ncbi:IclR family transcriptional regulator [Mesorhizobium sp. Cs1299R1N3]|uniref:IclR family transcriptional regulator n=1 Tax=Mesorhizobium sp. Cs1299R1N3 TaxID=3015173 RepID=UPI00301C6B4A